MRGVVNAHVHLELPAQATPAGAGLPAWVAALRAGPPPSAEAALANAGAVVASGATAVIDVSNLGVGAAALRAWGLQGLALTEVLGFNRPGAADGVDSATPHAPYSTHAHTIQAVAARPGPWSIHCDEDPAERTFLASGTGPWADYLRALGRDLSAWRPPGLTPVAWLAELGVLSPRALLVHCTLTEAADLDRIAEAGASIAVCPRSNLHISGRLPDVPAMLDRGIRVLVGTDSLASSPDLNVQNELAVLRAAFPQVPAGRWEACVTTDAWAFLGASA